MTYWAEPAIRWFFEVVAPIFLRAPDQTAIVVPGLLALCSAHNLIKLHIGNGLVRISA
jgi:hypothetical protein